MNAARKLPVDPIPRDAKGDWEREYVKYRLRAAGWALTAIGPALGLSYHAGTDTLRQHAHRSRRVEAKMAEILGVPAAEIWPSRYAARPRLVRELRRPE